MNMVNGQEEPYIQGWYSVRYNNKTPCPTILAETSIQKSTNWAWLLIPGKASPPPGSIQITRTTKKAVECTVQLGDGPAKTYRIPLAGAPKVTVTSS